MKKIGELRVKENIMLEKMIQEDFIKGYDCSQVVLAHFAEELGVSKETAYKVSACFGGGMMQGDACGAFIGALMTIGLKYGHFNEATLLVQKDVMMKKTEEFKQKFYEKFSSCNCKELLGYDVSVPEQLDEALSSGRMLEFCPKVVSAVIGTLEEVL